MKILYKCEICGESYDNEKDASDCEAQGTANKFREGETVGVRIVYLTPHPLKTTIYKIRSQKGTHEPFYITHGGYRDGFPEKDLSTWTES